MSQSALTRRALLSGLAVSAMSAPALFRPRPAHAAAAADRPLTLPPLDTGRIEQGRRIFDLTTRPGQSEFFAGKITDTIGINADYLGPVLSARAGERLQMNVINNLNEEMTLHWHGLHLPAVMDGGPHQMVAPGETWSPVFDLRQRAGTFWFHGHRMHATARHVWAGMAGVIRIDDDEEALLPLPRSYGVDDFTLVLQDRRFDANHQIPYAPTMHDNMAGMVGDVLLVNGQIGAYLDCDAPRIRLRILNGSNGSFYRLHFSDGRSFHQIASDGGLLSAPVALTEALMSPGERAEFIVNVDNGAPALLRSEVYASEVLVMGSFGVADVMEIRPRKGYAPAPTLPERLADLPPPAQPDGETRHFRLAMTGMGMMGNFTINGAQMAMERIDLTVPLGATETWVWENTTQMLHPIHIHDVQFRILSRNGTPPAPREAGLKDVVLVAPDETVELALSFTDFADPVHPYMYHCHILEHEDAGMMGQFTVV